MNTFNTWLITATDMAVTAIDAMALIIISAASVHAFYRIARLFIVGAASGTGAQDIYLGYGRALVAGLTFLLAADIVESSVVPTWESLAMLAAIAVIRTFLNFFLERDIEAARHRSLGESATGNTPADRE